MTRRAGSLRQAAGTLRAGARELLLVRWVRALAILALVALALRLCADPLLRFALDRAAASRDLSCTWEDLDLALIEGRGSVRGLRLAPRPVGGDAAASEPLLEVEYAIFDLDVLALLGGELRIARAEVDGMTSTWIREADGTWNAARHVRAAELLSLLESDEPQSQAAQPEEPRPIALAPPLALDALRLQQARFRLVDRTREPPAELALEVDAGLSDLRADERPARFAATLTGDDLLDGAHVAGGVTWEGDGLRATARAQLGGLRLQRLAPWLESLDVRPVGHALEAGGELELALEVQGEARDALGLRFTARELALRADGSEALALDELSARAETLSARGAVLQGIALRGLRGNGAITRDSGLRLAGLEVTGSGWQEPAGAWLHEMFPQLNGLPAWAALLVRSDPSAYPWRLGSLTIDDGRLDLADERVEPAAAVPLSIERIELGEVVHDPQQLEACVPVRVELRAPGVAERVTLEGSLDPFAPRRTLELALAVEGLGLSALDGHLHRAGLERRLSEARFELTLRGEAHSDADGRTEGRLEVSGASLSEDSELFGLRRLAAEGLVLDTARRSLRVGSLEIEAPHLAAGRDPTRGFFLFGLRVLGFSAADAPPAAPAPSTEASAVAALPAAPATQSMRLELGRVIWSQSRLTWLDEALEGTEPMRVEDLSFELEGLVVDGDPAAPPPEPARLKGRLVAPGLADVLELAGRVHSTPGGLDLRADLALRGAGLRGARIAPYLRPLGIEPRLDDARLELELSAQVAQEDTGAWRAEFSLSNLLLADGGSELLSIERLRVDDVRPGASTRIGALELEGARLELGRDEGGAWLAPALRLLPTQASSAESGEPPPSLLPALPWPALPPITLAQVSIAGLRIGWSDATLAPPLRTELALELQAQAVGTQGGDGTFRAALAIPETLERLALEGRARLGADGFSSELAVTGEGLRAGPLARLLPAGIELDQAGAAFAARIGVEVAPTEGDGLTARLSAREVGFGAPGEAPWLALDELALALALDPRAGALEVGEARAAGLELSARRDAEGVLHALGLRFVEAPPTPDVAAAPDPAPAEPGAFARPLPRLALSGPVALAGARLRYADATLGEDAPPFEARLDLELATPAVVISADAGELTPLAARLSGALVGLVERFELDASAAPFASEPSFDLRFAAGGVRTAGLVERLPALAARAAGTLEQGTLEARLRGALQVRRARPTEIGLGQPFAAELTLEQAHFRDGPGGAVLAGVERVALEAPRIDLARGLVHVESLDVTRPQGRLAIGADGRLHALGFALELVPAPASARALEREPAPSPAAMRAIEASAPVAGAAPPSELRVDRVLVSGIALELADLAVDPPVRVTLDALDVELAGLSTRALDEPRALRFAATLGAGATFEELALAGRASAFPEPAGWAQVDVTGLELVGFSGLAAAQGLALDDGALDAKLRLRLANADELRVDTTLVFSDLGLSEPAGGWLERTLSLPVALDSALFLLRNADGEHRFSTGVELSRDGISGAQIAAAGARAFAEVLARALAGAPLRLLGALVPSGDGGDEAPERVFEFAFAPGSTELEPEAAAALSEVARRLQADGDLAAVLRCELADGDAAAAERLANPSPDDCLELVTGLRQRKAELARAHARLATRARVERSVGAPAAERTGEELRATGAELAAVEAALDAVLEIVRSDAPRRRTKRTRGALREIAELRLAAVQQALAPRLETLARQRVELRAPRPRPEPELAAGRVVLELRER